MTTTSHARKLVLVRHALPVIVQDRPPEEWSLHDDAAADVECLAGELRRQGIDGIVTSPEPKAIGTAHLIATKLDIPVTEDDALREQGGGSVPWLEGEAFGRTVAEHFARPDEAVFGTETSNAAADRFAIGVDRACRQYTLPAIVTHGRVMCAWLRRAVGRDPMEIWPHLRLPDALLVDQEKGTAEWIGRS